MRRLTMFGGALLVAMGAFLLFMAYAFASMIDPEIQGPERTAELWRRMTGGGSPFALGVFLVIAGIWLAIIQPKKS